MWRINYFENWVLPEDGGVGAFNPVPDQGNVGTPAVCATILDAILSPSNHMDVSDGPMNIIP